jgi:hypothetical protein
MLVQSIAHHTTLQEDVRSRCSSKQQALQELDSLPLDPLLDVAVYLQDQLALLCWLCRLEHVDNVSNCTVLAHRKGVQHAQNSKTMQQNAAHTCHLLERLLCSRSAHPISVEDV